MLENIAALAIPSVISLAAAVMLFGRSGYFDSFIEGAREGLGTAIKILPTLIALVVAINMLGSSGLTDKLSELILPYSTKLGLPSEIIPLLITRPFSGSASSAAYSELLRANGAQSFSSLCASVIMGSSDTVVYIISLYFSSVGIKKSSYAFPCAIAVMLFSVFFSCFICAVMFK